MNEGPMLRKVLSEETLNAIQAEASRAHAKHGEFSMFGAIYTSGDRLAIIDEEVGEVSDHLIVMLNTFFAAHLSAAMGRLAHELTYDSGGPGVGEGQKAEMMKELNQVAAMAASWYEFLRQQLRSRETYTGTKRTNQARALVVMPK